MTRSGTDRPPIDLRSVILAAAAGIFPAIDGQWQRAAVWHPEVEGVVAFTGHAFVAVREDITDDRLSRLPIDGFGGAHHPSVLNSLAGPTGDIDCLDAVLIRRRPTEPAAGSVTGSAAGSTVGSAVLVNRPDLAEHPRARLASRWRSGTTALGRPDPSDDSVVTVARGLAGITELGIEIADSGVAGSGPALLAAALATLPDDLLLAAVSPGNARALRMFLAAGFRPIGSVQLFRRAQRPAG